MPERGFFSLRRRQPHTLHLHDGVGSVLTRLGDVQERAGVRVLSVLRRDGTPMSPHDELHPHSESRAHARLHSISSFMRYEVTMSCFSEACPSIHPSTLLPWLQRGCLKATPNLFVLGLQNGKEMDKKKSEGTILAVGQVKIKGLMCDVQLVFLFYPGEEIQAKLTDLCWKTGCSRR